LLVTQAATVILAQTDVTLAKMPTLLLIHMLDHAPAELDGTLLNLPPSDVLNTLTPTPMVPKLLYS
jgi:hypothetical protein